MPTTVILHTRMLLACQHQKAQAFGTHWKREQQTTQALLSRASQQTEPMIERRG